ncbi:serine hydrolase domain-containing protein [Sneathiella aquimaris]|uniref:serine hydrolase domain-containing protein n=1 Tax=Sneathiella aquimaris TaxID=2599305 RepID=UPI00146F0CB5|nr:serine hydrolase domain-containing protein [Sneathiella aquimaris]
MKKITSAPIEALLSKFIDKNLIAGGVAGVISTHDLPCTVTAGLADQGEVRQMAEDALFRIYSMTKPITSLAAMMLWEAGKFDLDDPVARYLPSFENTRILIPGEGETPASRQMTIRHVLTHTAGITLPAFSDDPLSDLYRKQALDGMRSKGNLAEVIDRLGAMPVLFEPGSRWKYSMATDILGRLVEIWSGLDFRDFLKDRIFSPLEMTETDFTTDISQKNRMTTNYEVSTRGIVGVVDPAQKSAFYQQPEFWSGSGGLVSTYQDFAKFMQLFLNDGRVGEHQLVRPETIASMTKNHLGGSMDDLGAGEFNFMSWDGIGFGLGFYVVDEPEKAAFPSPAGEYGWTGAAGTLFFINPILKIGGLLMVQHMPGNIYSLRSEFRRAVYDSVFAM